MSQNHVRQGKSSLLLSSLVGLNSTLVISEADNAWWYVDIYDIGAIHTSSFSSGSLEQTAYLLAQRHFYVPMNNWSITRNLTQCACCIAVA